MDRGLKIALASAVLLGGMAMAFMFRGQSTDTADPAGSSRRAMRLEKLELPLAGRRSATHPAQPDKRSSSAPGASGSQPAATILTTLAPSEPPPVLARDYPRSPDSSRWGTPIGFGLPRANSVRASQRTHRLEDGDTLEELAEHYLGDADRAMEIFEANRNVLSSPDVLPIGVEVKIPPRERPVSAPLPAERALVPIGAVPINSVPINSGSR